MFVNAFTHERGHGREPPYCFAVIQERGDPIIVPSLLVAEIASAVRVDDDTIVLCGTLTRQPAFPHLTLVSLTPVTQDRAAELAATYRTRAM